MDVAYKDVRQESMPYQATHYVKDNGSTLIRAGLPADSRITTRQNIFDEIDKLRRAEQGVLTSFRDEIVRSNDTKALNVFDNIFKVRGEYVSGIAAMIMGFDASTVILSQNEIKVFNRSKLVTSGSKTIEEMDLLYPRTALESPVKGKGVKGKYSDSHLDRFNMLKERVLKASISTDAGFSSAKMMSAVPAPMMRSVGKSSAGRSFFANAVKLASGSKVVKAAGRAIKSVT